MIVAWQGWRLDVPDRWSPIKIEGDIDQGSMLMADMHRPRLGVRWKTEKGRKFDPAAAGRRAMVREIGELAAKEAVEQSPEQGSWKAGLLYQDKEPPGRDVWVGYSPVSGRLFEIVYHAHHRDRVLTQRVLPTLIDAPAAEAKDWSVFELSCRTPAGVALTKPRLNAGDLALMFAGPRKQSATVRQIAVAKLALSRRPMQKWIADLASWRGRQFKLAGSPDEIDGPTLMKQRIVRRRRFIWMWWLPRQYTVLAKHDEDRDRLVLIDATDETMAKDLMDSTGWARPKDD